jgi:hypothetical protein
MLSSSQETLMPCETLDRLREEATVTSRQLSDTRAKARAMAVSVRSARPSGNDYDGFLQRKLQRLAAQIEGHKAEHGCIE